MTEIIASGEIVNTENLVVTATVAVETTEDSGESAAAKYSVYLNVKKYNADALPAEPLTYDTIAEMVEEESSEAAGMVVPGINGGEDVTLEAPTAIKYAKTKAFEGDNGVCVFGTLRYEY